MLQEATALATPQTAPLAAEEDEQGKALTGPVSLWVAERAKGIQKADCTIEGSVKEVKTEAASAKVEAGMVVARRVRETNSDEVKAKLNTARDGRQIAERRGLDWNELQRRHTKSKGHLRSGHWQEFCIALAERSKTGCEECDEIIAGQDQVSDPPDPAAADVCSQTAICKEDRPTVVPGDESAAAPANKRCFLLPEGQTLEEWLPINRPGVYEPLEDDDRKCKGLPHRCLLCQSTVLLQRANSTSHLLIHERSKKHRVALARSTRAQEAPAEPSRFDLAAPFCQLP